MSVTATRIWSALEDAVAALERLAQLLADERRALGRRASSVQLKRVAAGKRATAAVLEQADAARLSALHEAGYDSPAEAMEHFLRHAETPELVVLWQGFLVRLREVRALNEANGLAIRRSQALVSAELSLLQGGAAMGGVFYDAAGSCSHAARGRIISRA